ncbi:DUF368 domain-containing protein [Propioniciclava coleopterorum]|uniref:DUF368 domain-containing protein n=1 Tax=Propioniciclava coleopterorum TaxID=2714937 RepID=A0A6G7Y7D8_9ACTN|nr:DUF368 domain-containing protein [Propioniciclava coleopterorum]QIK72700.1 DUF368 domain-containing protein [Propioniciclava coleopterorum]
MSQTPSPDATGATPSPSQDAYLDVPESAGAWIVRLLKGIAIGIGFILPGLSGGVLAVIFKVYDPMIRFLANLRHRFWANVRYFIPIGIGGVIGVVLFSIVVAAAFGRYEAAFVTLFIGFVIGTFPSLWRQAGKQGRSTKDWIILAVAAVAIFAIMLVGGQSDLSVTPNIGVWLGSGALIGLGVIVPGMSPSNFLIYFGLYDKMAAGIKDFDPGVFLPLFVGLVLCVLLFAKGADWAFAHHYSAMYHFILGMVVGSSLAIFPTVVFTQAAIDKSGLSLPVFLLSCAVMLALGVLASWAFSKVEDRYSGEREAIDAGGR